MTLPEDLSQRWPTLNALLDEALALPESQRTVWLDSLTCEPADLKNTLRDLLAEQTRAQDETGLPMLQRLAGPDSQMPASTEPESGDTIGPYALLSELGRGGMGGGVARRACRRQTQAPRGAQAPAHGPRRRAGRSGWRTNATSSRRWRASTHRAPLRRWPRSGRAAYLAMEYIEGEAIDVYSSRPASPIRDRIGLCCRWRRPSPTRTHGSSSIAS